MMDMIMIESSSVLHRSNVTACGTVSMINRVARLAHLMRHAQFLIQMALKSLVQDVSLKSIVGCMAIMTQVMEVDLKGFYLNAQISI